MFQEQNHVVTNNTPKSTIPLIPKCISPLIFIFLDSIKLIFIQNPKLFFIIYTLGALPLSLLITSLTISTLPRQLKSHIIRLEYLFQIVDIWVEAGNVEETSQRDLKRLYLFKIIHALPILVFSLFTAVAVANAVVSSSSNSRKKCRMGLRDVWTALRATWWRTLTTSVVSVLFWVVWGHVLPVLNVALWQHVAPLLLIAVSGVVEVYLMMGLSVSIVVSAAEEKSGFEAVRVGFGLMKGNRFNGWVLSGLILVCTNCIGKEMMGVMDGGDWIGGYKWTVEMRVGSMIGLMGLLGFVVTWSYVIVTVFYCECRKRHGVIRQDDLELVDCDVEI